MRKKMRRTYPRKQGMEYIHGGNKMLKLSLKQGQYVNIGDNCSICSTEYSENRLFSTSSTSPSRSKAAVNLG